MEVTMQPGPPRLAGETSGAFPPFTFLQSVQILVNPDTASLIIYLRTRIDSDSIIWLLALGEKRRRTSSHEIDASSQANQRRVQNPPSEFALPSPTTQGKHQGKQGFACNPLDPLAFTSGIGSR